MPYKYCEKEKRVKFGKFLFTSSFALAKINVSPSLWNQLDLQLTHVVNIFFFFHMASFSPLFGKITLYFLKGIFTLHSMWFWGRFCSQKLTHLLLTIICYGRVVGRWSNQSNQPLTPHKLNPECNVKLR